MRSRAYVNILHSTGPAPPIGPAKAIRSDNANPKNKKREGTIIIFLLEDRIGARML
jgi:hypothetical protein